MHRSARILVLLLLAALPAATARAQWALNGNPVCTASGAQELSSIAADSLGGAVVVWQDYRNGATTDIYARQVGRSGAMQWANNGIALCTAGGYQQNPKVLGDGFGYLYYVWEDNRGANTDLYMAVTDRLGNVSTPANGAALCALGGDQHAFSMAANTALGTMYATWSDTRGGNEDVYLQGFNAFNLAFMGANGKAICTLPSIQLSPVCCDNWPSHDGAIVAWQDFRSGTNYDIYAQSTDLSGNTQWAANGIAVCTHAAAQISPMIVSDGAGGAIIAWLDNRNGTGHNSIFAQHLNSAGTKLWAADGVPLVQSTDLIILPKLIADGAGGAILAWEDDRNIATTAGDIYAQRVNGAGVVQWTANGVVVCNAPFDQSSSDVCSDGAGGCVISWQDVRVVGPANLYAQHLNAAGVPLWTANGLSLCNAAGNQFGVHLANVGGGGIMAAWEDRRGATPDIFAQRLDLASGQYGVVEPFITSIVDVPADQGGAVRLTFRPGDGDFPGMEYEVFDNDYHGGDVVAVVTNTGAASYTVDVLTVGVGVANTYFVSANGISNTVAGTSIDNLAPPAPTLTGARNGASVTLSWNSTAADIGHYSLVRADVGELGTPSTPGWTDGTAPIGSVTYRVRAIDVNGNVGPYSNDLVIASAVGVDGGVDTPRTLTLLPGSPNPFRDVTTLRFGTARDGAAKLGLYNVAGRRVATRVFASLPAGWHTVSLAGRDDAGRPLPAGMYFYRLDAGGESRSGRVVLER